VPCYRDALERPRVYALLPRPDIINFTDIIFKGKGKETGIANSLRGLNSMGFRTRI
jgi:hypothetical protein